LLLPARALRLLEEGVAGPGVAARGVWRELYYRRYAGRLDPCGGSALGGFGGSCGDAAAPALLQTWYKISIRRYGQAILRQPADGVLPGCDPRGRGRRRR